MKRINITLSQIEVFQKVVETGSFTTAGEQLGITQSAVSHAIAALEKELKVALLVRGSKAARAKKHKEISVTEIGQRVLIHAQHMLTSADCIHQATAAAIGLQTGRVLLGSFPSVSARLLPGLLRHFQQRYPGIQVVLFEGTDDEVREWIHTGAVDLGIVALSAEGLETLPIAQDELLAVVSCQHPLAQYRQVSVRQLSSEPFIMSKAGCQTLITALFHQVEKLPKTQFEILDLQTIFAMVRVNMGVTIAPEMALPSDRSDLHVMSLQPRKFRHLAFALPSLEAATPAVAEFLKEARHWLESQ